MRFTLSSVFPEIIIVEPDVYGDVRGRFLETYQAERYAQNSIPARFVQDNLSFSKKGVVRGLHYQLGRPQGKLVWVVQGEVYDVAVDIRQGSPTFGKWVGMTLSSDSLRQIYIPEGFAHGFCVSSETAILMYKCTDYYAPNEEKGLRWDDPTLAIQWPVREPVLSEKDSRYPGLKDIPDRELPPFVFQA